MLGLYALKHHLDYIGFEPQKPKYAGPWTLTWGCNFQVVIILEFQADEMWIAVFKTKRRGRCKSWVRA